MGEHYEHLSLEERCQIAQLRAAGQSIRQIATAVDRPPSTISRELKRNRGAQLDYKPGYAQEQARARRWTGSPSGTRRRAAQPGARLSGPRLVDWRTSSPLSKAYRPEQAPSEVRR